MQHKKNNKLKEKVTIKPTRGMYNQINKDNVKLNTGAKY